MNTNGKTRSAAGTAERAAETAACGRAAISCDNFTITAMGRQRKVSDFLSSGRENAVPLRHLKKLMETDGRTIRLMIQKERLSGMPICADNLTGYYLPANDEERTAFVRSMRHRAAEIMRTAEAIERAAKRCSQNGWN